MKAISRVKGSLTEVLGGILSLLVGTRRLFWGIGQAILRLLVTILEVWGPILGALGGYFGRSRAAS